MGLLILICALAALSFWAGFLARPHGMSFLSKAGFVVFLGLAMFTGYFLWREHRTVAELGLLIHPVPRISDVTYVPTPGEIQSIAAAAAAVPGSGSYGLGSTQDERRRFATEVEDLDRRFWKLETELSVDEVVEFYRDGSHRPGWELTTDAPPWLHLERPQDSLTLFVTEDWKSSQTQILYIHAPASGSDRRPAR